MISSYKRFNNQIKRKISYIFYSKYYLKKEVQEHGQATVFRYVILLYYLESENHMKNDSKRIQKIKRKEYFKVKLDKKM